MKTRLILTSLLSALLLVTAACGDDGTTPTDSGTASDTGTAGDTGTSGDSGMTGDTGTGTDAGITECFPIALDGTPLAIPTTFDDATPTWRRPHDEDPVCPATAVLPPEVMPVPFVAFAYCNEDSADQTVTIEMLANSFDPPIDNPLDDPYLVVYDGEGIPMNALGCSEINDDSGIGTKDAELTGVLIPAGGAITVVATAFQWTAAGPEGRGEHTLIVTVE